MNIVKPSILPGFLELLPQDQIVFNSMLDSIRKTYETFGFMPLDTPIIEKTDVLLAKGGGETEKQIYRFTKGDTDMSLRFDLTVPLARYTAQHSANLTFPFRRYQIGKVYRGERNQKGRFREFYQCDVDIIGQDKLSLQSDAEIISVINATFQALGFNSFTIRINNRKVLQGMLNYLDVADTTDVLRTLDKLDKIGRQKVADELSQLGLNGTAVALILDLIELRGTNAEILTQLSTFPITNEKYQLGVDELKQVTNLVTAFQVPEQNITIDLGIARGLDYYTGTVFETTLNDYPQIGSVCSGGRYDNLAEYYTTQKFPGVGASIGLTRLYYQLNEVGFFKDAPKSLTKVLVVPIGDVITDGIGLVTKLRQLGIPSQLYAEEGKLSKKLNYANKSGIPFVILIGEEEVASGRVLLKNMLTGEQSTVDFDQAVKLLQFSGI